MNARRRREHGQTLVEFALVFPIFMLLLFGLVDVGRLVYVNNALSQGAREGARWGSVPDWQDKATAEGLTCSGRAQCAAAHALRTMTAVPGATATASCTDIAGSTTDAKGNVIGCDPGRLLVVSVVSPVSMFTPVLSQLVGTQTVRAPSSVTINS